MTEAAALARGEPQRRGGAARGDAPQSLPADGCCTVQTGIPPADASVRRRGGWAPWCPMPTFVVGVLATVAVAVAAVCRGPARADLPVTPTGIVRWWGSGVAARDEVRVTVHGLEHASPGTAYVVVSNHQSNLDPMVHLRALPLSLRVLAKR